MRQLYWTAETYYRSTIVYNSHTVCDDSPDANASWHAFTTLAGAHIIFVYSIRNNTYLNAVYFDVGRRLHRHVPVYKTLVTRVNGEFIYYYFLLFGRTTRFLFYFDPHAAYLVATTCAAAVAHAISY